MRNILTLLLFSIGKLCFANMASPIWEGTLSSSALSSRDINIIKENIHIKIDDDFNTASYSIVYFINADFEGKQIPLLFHAKDYKGDFKICVDNQEIEVLDIPKDNKVTLHTPFEKFSNYFDQPSRKNESKTVFIYWGKNNGNVYKLNELKYFETDLTKGEHQIRVEYTASAWIDNWDWVKKYSFRYSLSPAKNWKSFDSLEITVDANANTSQLTTNLGQQTIGQQGKNATWIFTKIPADYFEIEYTPEINRFAMAMIAIGPLGITLIVALSLVLLHFFGIKKYRESYPAKKRSWVVLAGSIGIPFLILFCYTISFEIIDLVIGKEAGNFHGYTYIAIFLYPLFLPIYWIIMRLVDRRLINKSCV